MCRISTNTYKRTVPKEKFISQIENGEHFFYTFLTRSVIPYLTQIHLFECNLQLTHQAKKNFICV